MGYWDSPHHEATEKCPKCGSEGKWHENNFRPYVNVVDDEWIFFHSINGLLSCPK